MDTSLLPSDYQLGESDADLAVSVTPWSKSVSGHGKRLRASALEVALAE